MEVLTIQCPYCERYFPIFVDFSIKIPRLENVKRALDKIEGLDRIVIDILNFSRKCIDINSLYEKIREIYDYIDFYTFENIINLMAKDGLIFFPKVGFVKSI